MALLDLFNGALVNGCAVRLKPVRVISTGKAVKVLTLPVVDSSDDISGNEKKVWMGVGQTAWTWCYFGVLVLRLHLVSIQCHLQIDLIVLG